MNRRAFISTVALSLLGFMADRLEAELLNLMRSELSSLKAEIARRSALLECSPFLSTGGS